MIHATSHAGQLKLAAEYREADVRRAARERAKAEADHSGIVTLLASARLRVTGSVTRLRTLHLHAR
jgi:hypothetical protein